MTETATPTDHAGLDVLALACCLERLATVPVGRIGFVADEAEILRLNALGPHGWAGGDRPYWVRIRPFSITGRELPARA